MPPRKKRDPSASTPRQNPPATPRTACSTRAKRTRLSTSKSRQQTLTQIDFVPRPHPARGQLDLDYLDDEAGSDLKPARRKRNKKTKADGKDKRNKTLTQMDYVANLSLDAIDGLDLEYVDHDVERKEEDGVGAKKIERGDSKGKRKRSATASVEEQTHAQNPGPKKRRKITGIGQEGKGAVQSAARTSQRPHETASPTKISTTTVATRTVSTERSSDIGIPPEHPKKNPKTPQKRIRFVVPSSQSPSNSIASFDTPRQRKTPMRSPLKEHSNYIIPASPSPSTRKKTEVENDAEKTPRAPVPKNNLRFTRSSLSASPIRASRKSSPILGNQPAQALSQDALPDGSPVQQDMQQEILDARVISDSEEDHIDEEYGLGADTQAVIHEMSSSLEQGDRENEDRASESRMLHFRSRVIEDSQEDVEDLPDTGDVHRIPQTQESEPELVRASQHFANDQTQRTNDSEFAAATQLQHDMLHAASSYINYREPLNIPADPTVSQLQRPEGFTLTHFMNGDIDGWVPSSSPTYLDDESRDTETTPAGHGKTLSLASLRESQISTQDLTQSPRDSGDISRKSTKEELLSNFNNNAPPLPPPQENLAIARHSSAAMQHFPSTQSTSPTRAAFSPEHRAADPTIPSSLPTSKIQKEKPRINQNTPNHFSSSSPSPDSSSPTATASSPSTASVRHRHDHSHNDIDDDGLRKPITATQLLTDSLMESLPPPPVWDSQVEEW